MERTGKGEIYAEFWLRNFVEHVEDTGLDERFLLEWIRRKWDERNLAGFMCFGIRATGRLLSERNEFASSIKRRA